MDKEKFSLKDELKDLSDLISGEEELRKREEKIEKMKEEAKKEEKRERRRKVAEKEVVIEKEEVIQEKKVVQNVKLFEWEAPERAKISFSNKTYLILVAACLFLILFLAVLGKYGLMAAVIALLFLIYVWGTTEPEMVKYKITARGIDLGDKLYEWFMLDSFYFTRKNKQLFLFVETRLRFPPSLMFLLEDEDKDPIFVILQDKLLYKDIRKQNKMEKMAQGEYIKLEDV